MTQAPPGWYPQHDDQERYWNGSVWMADTRPTTPPPAPVAVSASPTQLLPSPGVQGQSPPSSKGRRLKHVLGYTATALVAMGIGGASAASNNPQAQVAASADLPAVTQTVVSTATVTAGPTKTVPVPGPTVTVKVPGPVKTVVAAPPPPAVAMPGDGTYQVGVDVKPGTYVSKRPDSGNCYWARLTGGDSLDSIIANGNSAGQVVVTIKKSDKFFESNGCSDWTRR